MLAQEPPYRIVVGQDDGPGMTLWPDDLATARAWFAAAVEDCSRRDDAHVCEVRLYEGETVIDVWPDPPPLEWSAL